MKDDITARLASRFDECEVLEQLHDVPPHEVWLVAVDGERAVCKFDTGPTQKAGVEGPVTTFVAANTSVPAPEVLALGADYFVTRWHPDAPTPGTEAATDTDWARAAGRGLATLHAETAPHLDRFGRITPASTPDAIVVDGHRHWHDAAIEYVRDLESTLTEHGHGDVAAAALDHLGSHPDGFVGVGDPVCCHGWWSPEHVAVREGEVACVVDFEHAFAAPGEWDYWRTVLPVFDGGDPQDAFRDGYESVRPLASGVAARRPWFVLLHTLYFFESLYVQAQHDEAATETQADWLRERVFEVLDETA